MWSWAVRAAVLMTALAVAESSLAAEPADAGADASRRSRGILPPRALDAAAAYPAGATGDASVVLELTVGTDGTVSDVSVVEGPEPFASAARAAAATWRFEPALRDGLPVKARIRFEARFTGERRLPPEPEKTSSAEPDPAPPASGGTDAVPAGSPAGKEYAVTVQGRRAAPGGVSVSRAEVRTLPGAFGDPFRAVESLPGVTPVVSAVPLFFIRGAPPGNIGYFIDGVRVPLLFHALLGPAVIQPSFIDRIDVYRGAAPVRYGRFAGGVVAASTAQPPDELHGEAGLRLLDVGGTIGTPFADGSGHVMAGGRYSYTGLILSSTTNAVLDYWDYQFLADYELGRNDKLGVFAFGAFDYLGQDNAQNFAGTQFHRVDLRYDHRFGANTKARAAFTVGYDRSSATTWTENDISIGEQTGPVQGQQVSDRSLAGRLEVEHRMGDSVLRLGGDASLDDYGLAVSDPTLSFRDAQTLFRSRNDLVGGAYVDLEWHPDRRITVTPGVRADVYRSQGRMEYGIDPRIGADFQVSKRVKLTHSLGLSHQAPNYLPNLPGAQIGGLRGGLQTALQASSGVEAKLGGDVLASVTFFDQIFFNLSDPLGFSRSIAANVDVVDVRALGASYGVELMVQRSLTRRLGGMLSYTLSRTERSRENINSLSAFDHTHVGSLALGYDLGKKWRVGARAAFTSGVPTRTLTVSGPSFGGERGPPFFRLDLRIEKRFRLGQRGYWGLTAEVVNATAGTEVTTRSCSALRCTTAAVGPLVLPNIGVEAGF